MTETFKCEMCGKAYPTEDGRTHEQKMAEHMERFESGKYGDVTNEDPNDYAIVCHDCFQKISDWSCW